MTSFRKSFSFKPYVKPHSNNELCNKAIFNTGSPFSYIAFPKMYLKVEAYKSKTRYIWYNGGYVPRALKDIIKSLIKTLRAPPIFWTPLIPNQQLREQQIILTGTSTFCSPISPSFRPTALPLSKPHSPQEQNRGGKMAEG